LSGNPAEAARLAHAQIVQLSGDTVCRMAINMSWRPMTADWTIEQTDNALNADQRNFYEVEKWTKDGSKIDCLLYAGSSLDKAHEIFRDGRQAPAANKVVHPAANKSAGGVAPGR
jgi:hypothetical protein